MSLAKGARRAHRVGAGCARVSELNFAQARTQRGVGLGKGCSAAVQSSRPIDGCGPCRTDEVFEHCWRVRIIEIDHITRSQRVASVVGGDPQPVLITNNVGSYAIEADVTRQYVQQMTHGGSLGKVKVVFGEVLRDGYAHAGFVAQEMQRLAQAAVAALAEREHVEVPCGGFRQVSAGEGQVSVEAQVPRGIATTAKVEIDELYAKPAEHGAGRALILRHTRGDFAADK